MFADFELRESPGQIHVRAYHQRFLFRVVIGLICLLVPLSSAAMCIVVSVQGDVAAGTAFGVFTAAMVWAPLAVWNRTAITLTSENLSYFVGPALPRWGSVARSELASLDRTRHTQRDEDGGRREVYRLVLKKTDGTKVALGTFHSREGIDRLLGNLELPRDESWF